MGTGRHRRRDSGSACGQRPANGALPAAHFDWLDQEGAAGAAPRLRVDVMPSGKYLRRRGAAGLLSVCSTACFAAGA